jgi:hypothetical protein
LPTTLPQAGRPSGAVSGLVARETAETAETAAATSSLDALSSGAPGPAQPNALTLVTSAKIFLALRIAYALQACVGRGNRAKC